MDISLSDEQRRFIDEKVRTGCFESAQEVVRAGVRRLMEDDAAIERRLDAWRGDAQRKIEEGWEEAQRGEFVAGEVVGERLKQRVDARRAPAE